MTTALLPGDSAPPIPASDRSARIRQWHTRTVRARAEVVEAAARSAAAEAAFDDALDDTVPMSTLRVLDREMDDTAREHRAAIADADRLARVLANTMVVTTSETATIDPSTPEGGFTDDVTFADPTS